MTSTLDGNLLIYDLLIPGSGCISALCVSVCVCVGGRPQRALQRAWFTVTPTHVHARTHAPEHGTDEAFQIFMCETIQMNSLCRGSVFVEICCCTCAHFQTTFWTHSCSHTEHHQQLEWKSSRIFQCNPSRVKQLQQEATGG